MHTKRLLPLMMATLVCAGLSTQAHAQSQSTADPSRVQGQIAPIEPQTMPELQGKVTAQKPAVNAPEGAEKVKFKLQSVKVEGTSIYDDVSLRSVYGDMIGTTISLADIYGLAQQLTVKYRNEGYILTQVVVPPQTIDGGHIKLRVVEGFIDKVSIEGSVGRNTAFLQGFAEKVRKSKPLDAKALERYILLINDLPGLSARAVLSPSPTVIGASDLTVIVERKMYDLFAQLDNRGSRYLGPLQLNMGTRLNNTLGFYEGLSFQVVTAPDGTPDRELDYAAFSWAQPINFEGTKISIGGSITSTDPGHTLSTFNVEGLARSANIELLHPFIRSRQQNLYAALRFNYLDTERTDNLGLGKTEDRLRVLRLSGTYQFTDGLLGLNTFSSELSKGIDILNMKDKNSVNPTRARGEPEFFKATMEISRVQRVTNHFEVFASAQGQKSAHKLLASEEFGVGGATFGSAYNNSEITGEDGIAGRIELRLNNPVETPASFVQLYGFYDIGKVWDNDNTVVRDRQRSLASTGAGVRVNVNENFAGTIEVAVPLTRKVEAEGDKDPRVFGSVTARF